MDVVNIGFEPSTCALSMTFLPDPNDPNEMALMGCIYSIIMAFPDDPHSALKYSLACAKILLPGSVPGAAEMAADAPAAKAMLQSSPEAMAAVKQGSQLAYDAINAP